MNPLIGLLKERIAWHTFFGHLQTVYVLQQALEALEKQDDSQKCPK